MFRDDTLRAHLLTNIIDRVRMCTFGIVAAVDLGETSGLVNIGHIACNELDRIARFSNAHD
jgi:hypothetical protein